VVAPFSRLTPFWHVDPPVRVWRQPLNGFPGYLPPPIFIEERYLVPIGKSPDSEVVDAEREVIARRARTPGVVSDGRA
jgi:hypothetical protein